MDKFVGLFWGYSLNNISTHIVCRNNYRSLSLLD